jgi:hypothetical protein
MNICTYSAPNPTAVWMLYAKPLVATDGVSHLVEFPVADVITLSLINETDCALSVNDLVGSHRLGKPIDRV